MFSIDLCTNYTVWVLVKTISRGGEMLYLCIGVCLKWQTSQTPYLIQYTTIAPHITGS